MINLYKETKNFIVIAIAVLIVGCIITFQLISYIDISNNNISNLKVNIIYDIDK